MTLKVGSRQACASCKHQRRKCVEKCPLAPFFPPDKPKLFESAHRLFGVSNMLKIIEDLSPSQKVEAMRSIIYQSHIRERFPVLGCCEIIYWLQHQIHLAEEELQVVLAQLEMHRQQNYNQRQLSSVREDDASSLLELGMAPPSSAQQLFNYFPQPYNSMAALPQTESGVYSSAYMDSDDNSERTLCNAFSNLMPIQSQLVAVRQPPVQQEHVQDFEGMPFFDATYYSQSCADSKGAYETSSEESAKDTMLSMERVGDNELKSAAACFSLTSAHS